MASNLLNFRPTRIQLVRASSAHRKPDPNHRKSTSSPNWFAPIFGWSSEPDYIDSEEKKTEATTRSRFAPGCFTEEKARQLRLMTKDTESFHDAMYHSAIASRLASDFSQRSHF